MNLQQLYELRRAERAVGETVARLPRRTEISSPKRREKARG
jgi:hypothetical protein